MKRYEQYANSKGFKYIPSYTNFITMYLDGYSSKEVASKLLQKGVIVRDMTGYGFNALRITIGTQDQNTKVFEVLDSIL
jgi:histidinol-phosphate aminotransferase